MNMNAQAYDIYKKATVETVSPAKLLIMLYDGAIKNLDNACQRIKEKDIAGAHNHIIKAQDIIVELMASLKMEYEISKQLLPLYQFYYRQLVQANIKKDITLINQVKGFLTELKGAWEEAAKSLHKGTALTAESSPLSTPTGFPQNKPGFAPSQLNIKG